MTDNAQTYLVVVSALITQPALADVVSFDDLFKRLKPLEDGLAEYCQNRSGVDLDGSGMGPGSRDWYLYTDDLSHIEGFQRVAIAAGLDVETGYALAEADVDLDPPPFMSLN